MRRGTAYTAHDLLMLAADWADAARGRALDARGSMKAVVYRGVRSVAVERVEDARIEEPTDALVRITSSAVCGTELHVYDGHMGAEPGLVLGTSRSRWSRPSEPASRRCARATAWSCQPTWRYSRRSTTRSC
jgi:hypothetical protein